MLDAVVSQQFIERAGYFGDDCEQKVYELNHESGLVDDTYAKIREKLCETYQEAYNAALKDDCWKK
jgi:hypothetical protein